MVGRNTERAAAVDGQILLREEGRIRFVLSGGKGVAFPVGQEVFTAAGKGQNQLIALLDVNRRAGAVGDRSVLQDQPDRVAFGCFHHDLTVPEGA